jgi:anti-anti-sigma factor
LREVQVVELSGDLDIARAAALRDELRRSIANDDVGLVVDLGEVRYLDSAGVNVLFEIAESLAERQLAFAVVIPAGGLVERVVELVDLGAAADLHQTVEAAVAAMQVAG